MIDRDVDEPGPGGGVERERSKVELVGRVGDDQQPALKVGVRAAVRPEIRGTLRRGAQRNPGLGGHRGTLLPVGMGLVGIHVVLCQDAGELVITERLVVARGGEMARAPIVAREGAVGDLAQEALDESVVSALR